MKTQRKRTKLRRANAATTTGIPAGRLCRRCHRPGDFTAAQIINHDFICSACKKVRATEIREHGVDSGKIRTKRTAEDIAEIKRTIYSIVEQDRPMTVRGVAYRLAAIGMIPKLDKDFGYVSGWMTAMRRDDELPYEWVVDYGRRIVAPQTYSSIKQALLEAVEDYRLDVWADLPDYPIIGCEKETLTGIFTEETWSRAVPLVPIRGNCGETYVNDVAQLIISRDKPVTIYYFGDYDMRGVGIDQDFEQRLRRLVAKGSTIEITFERVAVNADQIKALNLPIRPSKETSEKFTSDESVDVDAVPAPELRRLARVCIERHLPRGHLARIKAAQEAAQQSAKKIIKRTRF